MTAGARQEAAGLEIRIPISPTRSFFQQVRFFEYNLRRLGGVYATALLRVVVGDDADMAAVRAQNRWSAGRPVEWIGVPSDIFARYGMWGTADYRLLLEPVAGYVALADADTVWLRDIDPLLQGDAAGAWAAGHMAHLPPPVPADAGTLAGTDRAAIWPPLLAAFGLREPERLYRYSMDKADVFGRIPPYFNLGFVLLSAPAQRICGRAILPVQDRLGVLCPTPMRCQIALTLACLTEGVELRVLPAEYNAANDPVHAACNGLSAGQVRVLHYLRPDELRRERILLPEHRAETRALQVAQPFNRLLLERVAEFLDAIAPEAG